MCSSVTLRAGCSLHARKNAFDKKCFVWKVAVGVALERCQGVAFSVFSAQPQVPCRCGLHDDRS